MTNFCLHDEQTVNGLRKIAWASVSLFSLISPCPCLHVTTSPRLHVTMSPCLRVSTSPCLNGSMSLCLHVSTYPHLHVSMSPCLRVSMSPCLHVSVFPCLHVHDSTFHEFHKMENRTNGKRQLPFVLCEYKTGTANFLLFAANGNGKTDICLPWLANDKR
jgi:hypothetical protein